MSDSEWYEPLTPGDALRLLLNREGITQDELASATGVSRYSVNQIVNHKRAVTAEMALRLGKALSTSPEFWLNLQQAADLSAANQRLSRSLQAVKCIRKPLGRSKLVVQMGVSRA